MGATCEVVAGDSASPECVGSTCDFTAGNSASISCRDGAVCDVTVTGQSSTVACEGSTCTVRCEMASCGVDCGTGSTCTLQCAGDATPQVVPAGMNVRCQRAV